MLTALILLLCFEAVVIKPMAIDLPNVVHEQESHKTMFKNFMAMNRRSYANDEETAKRFEIFKQNLEYIKYLNEKYKGTTTFGITPFADYTHEEMQKVAMKLPPQYDDEEVIPYEEHISSTLPSSFDWRDQSKVTPVKTQGNCNACWAFAGVAVVESLYAIKTNISTDLSEQELVDCDTRSDGCTSGFISGGLRVVSQKGLLTEDQHPYQGVQGTCPTEKGSITIQTINRVGRNGKHIARRVYNHGPVAVLVKVTPPFYLYNSGIFNPSQMECNSSSLHHACTIVGFGESENQKYWIIKNSWGTEWGEQGYFKFARGGNLCDVEKYPFSATM